MGVRKQIKNKMRFLAKTQGTFEKTQTIDAHSQEEAIEKLKGNLGENIDETAISELEILEIDEVE